MREAALVVCFLAATGLAFHFTGGYGQRAIDSPHWRAFAVHTFCVALLWAWWGVMTWAVLVSLA